MITRNCIDDRLGGDRAVTSAARTVREDNNKRVPSLDAAARTVAKDGLDWPSSGMAIVRDAIVSRVAVHSR